ncbi:phenylacetic acid degradation protein PaaN [Ignavibacteria bacterium]|nr:phenylacetic acid degradation protein PaaN [Bacteroidota bacterium]MCZ2132433.1 phenylacetic acid degradation protein PaaN [Bacteroidota bacterium]
MTQLTELVERHSAVLSVAAAANRSREFYAHWPEAPSGKIYGETANADGTAEFEGYLNKFFDGLNQEGASGRCGNEVSPYGFSLGITYPAFDADTLVQRAKTAQNSWRKLSPDERAAVLLECLERAAKHFFTIGYATMHTTGQGFVMAFQASGPHAFDRALEAVATALAAQKEFAGQVEWKKPMGKTEIVLDKRFHIVPRGINLTIGCSTFPLWNSFPGIFASLATGNASIAKTHPGAILPVAICIASFRRTIGELGLNPDIIQLAADNADAPVTWDFVLHKDIALIDYTGGSAFGEELERKIAGTHKMLYTEKAGVNCVILDSTENLDAALDNLAFGVSLYSGQMCTAPQNIFIPKNGVTTPEGLVTPEDTAKKFAEKIDSLIFNEKIGPGTLGAVQNEVTANRVVAAASIGKTIRESAPTVQAGFGNARTASPLVIMLDEKQNDVYEREWFGPISFIIPVDSFDAAVEKTAVIARSHGALSGAVYTVEAEKKDKAEDILIQAGVPVSFNFTGPIWANQSAAFSDFHGTGINPAGSASFADYRFVATRFAIVGSRSK